MGITEFEFIFQGNREMFVSRVEEWVKTPKGKGYSIRGKGSWAIQSSEKDLGKLKLSKGNPLAQFFLDTWATRMEFRLVKETNDYIEICAKGFISKRTYFFIPIKHGFKKEIRRFGSRTIKGWDNMLSLLSFLGVEDYNYSYK